MITLQIIFTLSLLMINCICLELTHVITRFIIRRLFWRCYSLFYFLSFYILLIIIRIWRFRNFKFCCHQSYSFTSSTHSWEFLFCLTWRFILRSYLCLICYTFLIFLLSLKRFNILNSRNLFIIWLLFWQICIWILSNTLIFLRLIPMVQLWQVDRSKRRNHIFFAISFLYEFVVTLSKLTYFGFWSILGWCEQVSFVIRI